jgi:NodT family efflux transporter outer membrane factor (OMF) lipoprotein
MTMVSLPSLRFPLSAGVATACLLSACVGPDFAAPAAPEVSGYTQAGTVPDDTAKADVGGGEAQHLAAGKDIPGQWWTLFHSQPLNALIDRSLKANADIAAAQAALRAANEATAAQRGAYWPQVAGGLAAERQKTTSGNASPTSPVNGSQGYVFNTYTTQVAVSYTPDVWGANYRQVESLDAQAEAQRFQLEATYLALTANVVADAVTEAGLRGQIAATRDIIRLDQQTLDILQKLYDLGTQPRAAVAAQRAQLEQDKQTLPPLLKALEQNRDAMAALAGGFPSQDVAETFELASLTLPADLPLSLPSKLVEQRPDIRQAEANLHAASANVGVAIAARLPVLNLTATMGSTAPFVTGAQGLFTPGTGTWSLGSSVLATLFDGFGMLHKQRQAEALLDQAKEQYRSTVITAFQNVADALHAIKQDADALAAAVAAEKATADSLEITRKQLETGTANYLSLIVAQQAESKAIQALVQAQAARYADTAALFQALGGGWWNRADVTQGAAE